MNTSIRSAPGQPTCVRQARGSLPRLAPTTQLNILGPAPVDRRAEAGSRHQICVHAASEASAAEPTAVPEASRLLKTVPKNGKALIKVRPDP